jgi:hypothetical protein
MDTATTALVTGGHPSVQRFSNGVSGLLRRLMTAAFSTTPDSDTAARGTVAGERNAVRSTGAQKNQQQPEYEIKHTIG